jgi:hypothetical protein
MDEAQHELDSAASQLEIMLQTNANILVPSAPVQPAPVAPSIGHTQRHEFAKT